MQKNCQNPLCEHASAQEVSVSVEGPSDETRSLCGACKVAFDWGVRHGRMTNKSNKVWVLAVTCRGQTVHGQVVKGKLEAVKALAEYLRAQEDYVGPAELPGICDWLAEYHERLGVDIFPASLDVS